MLTMKRTACLLIASGALLAGCAGWRDMDKGLQALYGQRIEMATQRLGYPTAEQTIGGMRLLVWSHEQVWTENQPQRATTYGMRRDRDGRAEYRETTDYVVPVVRRSHCTLKLHVDEHGVIRGGDYSGDLMTCQRYIHALNGRRWLFDGP